MHSTFVPPAVDDTTRLRFAAQLRAAEPLLHVLEPGCDRGTRSCDLGLVLEFPPSFSEEMIAVLDAVHMLLCQQEEWNWDPSARWGDSWPEKYLAGLEAWRALGAIP